MFSQVWTSRITVCCLSQVLSFLILYVLECSYIPGSLKDIQSYCMVLDVPSLKCSLHPYKYIGDMGIVSAVFGKACHVALSQKGGTVRGIPRPTCQEVGFFLVTHIYWFQWPNGNSLVTFPCTGYLHPRKSENITVTFKATQLKTSE